MEDGPSVPWNDAEGYFNILAVCTANVCRSPLMAALLLDRVGAGPGRSIIRVGSAGTMARQGNSICPLAGRRLRSLGPRQAAYADEHRSRRLTARLADSADLILVPDLANRSRVIRLHPDARTRTFTLTEAVQLSRYLSGTQIQGASAEAGDEHLGGLAERLNEWRVSLAADRGSGRQARDEGVPAEIRDGHNLSLFAHLGTVKQIANGVDALSAVLLAARGSRT